MAVDADPDHDGLTNWQEYILGTNPNDYYSQGGATITPVIEIITSGDHQTGAANTYLAQPLAIKVHNGSLTGPVLLNAPVRFDATGQNGGLAAASGATSTSAILDLQTDPGTGLAQPYYKQGSAWETQSQIKVTSGSATQKIFTENAGLTDTDYDGMPDSWETAHFGNLNAAPGDDPDEDGLTNLQEYQQGSDPNNYYNQGATTITPAITIAGGNRQVSAADAYLPIALRVEVRNSATGALLHNAPVIFDVASGGGGIALASGSATVGEELNLRTDSNGRAQVYFKQGSEAGVPGIIMAQTGTKFVEFDADIGSDFAIVPSDLTIEVPPWGDVQTDLTLLDGLSQGVNYGVRYHGDLGLDTPLAHAGDNSGHRWESSDDPNGPPYVWEDISTTGTRLDALSASNGAAQNVTLPFSFPFYGNNFTTVTVYSSGTVTVGGGYIYGLFSYYLNPQGGGNIYFKADANHAVIQYENINLMDGSPAVTFQIVLCKNGDIKFYYKDMASLPYDAEVSVWGPNPYPDESVSIFSSWDFYNYNYYIHSGAAILISDHSGFTAVSPDQGSVGSQSCIGLKLDANANNKLTGDYIGQIEFYDTAGAVSSTWLNMTIHVKGVATTEDADGDGLPDTWEMQYFWNLDQSGRDDPDHDGISNADEYRLNKDPMGGSDNDSDGMSDTWEMAHFGNLNAAPGDDADGDGLTNLQEYLQGSDPLSYYRQGAVTITPVVTITGGNEQLGTTNEYLAEPLKVEVRNGTGGALLANAPVVFFVVSGGGGLAAQAGSTQATSPLTVSTDHNGVAQVSYLQGPSILQTNQIDAQAGTSNVVHFSTVQAGLWGYWSFDEGYGDFVGDSSELNHAGTLINNPQWSDRFHGSEALTFNGATSEGGAGAYATMGSPSDGAFDFGNDSFSIIFWVNYTVVNTLDGSSGRRMISKGDGGSDPGYFIGLSGDGKITVGLGSTLTGQSAESLLFKTTQPFNDGVWHQVAVIFDRAAATGQIYVDGAAQNLEIASGAGGAIDSGASTVLSYSALTHLSATSADTPLTIASQNGTQDFFKGSMDDVKLYRRALSAIQAHSLYDSDNDGLPDDWEIAHFGNLDVVPGDDPDGDGLTNLQEFQQGSDPQDYFSQGGATVTPVVAPTGGDQQSGAAGEYLAAPLKVEVRNGAGGALLANAPVTFIVTEGDGVLATHADGIQFMKSKTPKAIVCTKPTRGFNQELAERICERIASGESLRMICSDASMPGRTTVCRWLAANERFQKAMSFARDLQTDTLIDEILDIADTEPDVQRARLRIDARIWFASKVRPKKYGNKPETDQEERGVITVRIGGLDH